MEKCIYGKIQKNATIIRRRASKLKQLSTNKRIVIIIPEEIKKQFLEAVKHITSLSPKQRGRLFINTIVMIGISIKEPNITKIIESTTDHTKSKKKQNKKSKQSEITNDKIEGVEKI